VVLTIEPGSVTSLEGSFHQKIQKVATWVRLDAYTTDNFSFVSIGLILQEK
jgi:hypothetical protein